MTGFLCSRMFGQSSDEAIGQRTIFGSFSATLAARNFGPPIFASQRCSGSVPKGRLQA
jgi:hypothetical protein